jgi:hypothetical protein
MLHEIWRRYEAGALPRGLLVRALFDHSPWWGPADAAGALRRVETAEGPVLELSAAHAEGPVVAILGEQVPALLEPSLAGVRFILAPGVVLRFDPDQFELLRAFALALEVEVVIAGGRPGDVTGMLSRHPRYWVGLDAGGTQISLAPDARGRRLVAICTAPDALDALLEAWGPSTPAQIAELDGDALFALVCQQDIEGLVFNPAGPLHPRAFSRDFAFRCRLSGGEGKASGSEL